MAINIKYCSDVEEGVMRVNYENNYTKLGLHHAYWGHTYAPTDGKLYIYSMGCED